jgi:peptide/nickel transport system substrate-binding protein
MKSINRYHSIWIFSAAAACLLLAACSPSASKATATPIPATPTAVVPTQTPEPRVLTVCLGQEPDTLYPYGSTSQAMWSVLEAVYDGPFDTNNYSTQPVILEKLPTFADGDAVWQSVDVAAGAAIVDADGNLTTLQKGVKIRPSVCRQDDCMVTYDGTSKVQMDEMAVTFKMKSGVNWSDGTPVKASDSVYSFNLAADKNTPVSKISIRRTTSYKALDDQTVQWISLPGESDPKFDTRFWIPLPEHLWGGTSSADLLTSEISSQKPVGWGPFTVDEWVKGDHIRLVKNAGYFRASEGLPKVDVLVYRFLGTNADDNLSALLSGECDLVDQTSMLDQQLSALTELMNAKKVHGLITSGPYWEHLDFNIKPAIYDNGPSAAASSTPDYFGDARTRQAFAYCIDRDSINKDLLGGYSAVPGSFFPSGHPQADADVETYTYDPTKGEALLDEVGWKDTDNNPDTPRIAVTVPNVIAGTPLEVTYATTQATLRKSVSDAVTKSLAGCGIKAAVAESAPTDLYASGPDGPLFGRKFNLTEFFWELGAQPVCSIYQTDQIPTAGNHWIGSNITGYSSAEFDAACNTMKTILPEEAGYQDAQNKVQEIFAKDMPVVPLYQILKVAAARSDLCGVSMDASSRSEMWNIENFEISNSCPAASTK